MMARACVSTKGLWNRDVLSHPHQSLVLGETALPLSGGNAAGELVLRLRGELPSIQPHMAFGKDVCIFYQQVCISPGLHTRADPVVGDSGEPVLRV